MQQSSKQDHSIQKTEEWEVKNSIGLNVWGMELMIDEGGENLNKKLDQNGSVSAY